MKRKGLLIMLCALVLVLFAACDSAHEHEFGKWKETKEATCEKVGKEVRKCDCGEEETRAIAKLEHEYEVEETPATCQEAGVKTFTCKNCGDSYEEELEQKGYTSTEIYNMYLSSVGEVVTYDRSGGELALGSCFVYSGDGKLITNYHVIEDAYSAKVTFGETTYQVDKVLAYDKDIDVAVLQINADSLAAATLCEKAHSVGEVVYAFGNSRGLTSTFSDGMITYSDRELDGVHYVQHDAPISGGNSGGPLINIYGEVIGINTWTVRDSQNLNFAIGISELNKLDYSTPMTMAELYNKESNAYKKISNYVATYGELDDGGEYYYLELDYFYSSDYTTRYSIFAMYYPAEGEILLGLNDTKYYAYFVLTEELDGIYSWSYFDDNDYQLVGTLYGATYSGGLLGYSNHNVYNAQLRSALQNLASTMIDVLCQSLDECFEDIGVTVA